MGRFYGLIGFLITEETFEGSGIWAEKIVERPYYGDVLKHRMNWRSGEQLNDNLTLNNDFSILADTYAYQQIGAMKYVKWNNICWAIMSAEVEYPRIRLTIGGVYTGGQAGTPENAK